MEITVRRAGSEDLALLVEWRMRVLREVFAEFPSPDWEALRASNTAYYEEHLSDGLHTACFALNETGEIVGCGGICYQYELPSPDNPGGLNGYLMNIYTVPKARGDGVAREVLNFLTADAKRKGAGKIYLESTDSARALYESAGFVPMRDYYKL